MIGIVKGSLPEAESLSGTIALQVASQQGLDGVLFNSVFDLSPNLDVGEMRAIREEADRLGLQMSAMLGVLNPALPIRCDRIVAAGDGELEIGVKRLIVAAAAVGIHELSFIVGMIEDRFRLDVSWNSQLDRLGDLILRCGPILRAHGSRFLIKTHEEITTMEIVRLVNRVGPELLGVAFDPVNVLCRIEDPVAAAQRIAPFVARVHMDDAVVRFQDAGIRRFLAPVGEGAIDWVTIIALMEDADIWLEMHGGQFSMPVFDPQWLRMQPEIALNEFSSVLGMAVDFGAREVPWDQSAPTSRLSQTCAAVHGLVRSQTFPSVVKEKEKTE